MSTVALVEPLARSGEAAKSGPIGLAIILILCIACYFLFKSMSKHLKTVREDFPVDGADQRVVPDGSTVTADASGEPVAPTEPAESAEPEAPAKPDA